MYFPFRLLLEEAAFRAGPDAEPAAVLDKLGEVVRPPLTPPDMAPDADDLEPYDDGSYEGQP